MRRFFGLIDLAVLTVVVVAVILPPREMYAADVIKGDAPAQFALALAEARTMADPKDGVAAQDFAHAVGEAGQKDLAIDFAVAASDRATGSPTRWRALIAAASAFVDRLDVKLGLDYANRALAACETARDAGDVVACPPWEQVRMELYQRSLNAGVKSGIDPRRDPRGFRKASESQMLEIHVGPNGGDRGTEPTSGSPNGSGATAPTGGSATAP